jgi:hypothetical protein
MQEPAIEAERFSGKRHIEENAAGALLVLQWLQVWPGKRQGTKPAPVRGTAKNTKDCAKFAKISSVIDLLLMGMQMNGASPLLLNSSTTVDFLKINILLCGISRYRGAYFKYFSFLRQPCNFKP